MFENMRDLEYRRILIENKIVRDKIRRSSSEGFRRVENRSKGRKKIATIWVEGKGLITASDRMF